MRKEAKYNLIFAVVLLALCVPGVIMLVKKKIQQQGDMRGGMSAPVPHQAVYVDPLPKGSNIRGLIIPPQTHAWALSLGGRTATDNRVNISQNRSFEVIERQTNDDGQTLTILLWDPRVAPNGGLLRAAVEQDTHTIDALVGPVDPVLLPDEIRGELRRSGYSAAPRMIHRTTVHLPPTADQGVLVLTRIAENRSHADRIDLEIIAFNP